jgi:hypothetical protein
MHEQFLKDLSAESPSLLAKWLKRENTSSPESRRLATITRKKFGFSPRTYRRLISSLCKKINVVEQKMCSEEWEAISYEHVPSKASLIYRKGIR